ncbi:MAG: glycosyltransferase family 2 protein [Deltaproteobacteria bacterium]|nr:glycosyltransferase family 2 protein [Deltaproteobacteria bacterium]
MEGSNHTAGTGMKQLSVIIISYNTRDILKECLRRVMDYGRDLDMETIVVDNASTDGSPVMVRKTFPEVTLITSPKNLGFAAGNNLGLKRASGRFLLLLNSDAYLMPGVLQSTLQWMNTHPRCGILGVKLTGEDGSLQPSARRLPNPLRKLLTISGAAARFPESRVLGETDHSAQRHAKTRETAWVPGAFFLIRREVVEDIGFLDERYFLYFEEIDFCLRARRAGWKIFYYPHARVIHLGGESSKRTNKPISRSGWQLIRYRLESEFRYYRKNFGCVYVLAAAGTEFLWHFLVWTRNRLNGIRRREKTDRAYFMMRAIVNTLIRDRFGLGVSG